MLSQSTSAGRLVNCASAAPGAKHHLDGDPHLGHRTDELAESRLPLITAGDAERSRLEREISRQVVPHLAPLPNRLRHLSNLDPYATTAVDAALLGSLIASLNTALEALREITRGVFPPSSPAPASRQRSARSSLEPEYRPTGGQRLRSRTALLPAAGGCGVLLCG
jgi:hypothetical protein